MIIMTKPLADKIAVVTGASRGIGRSIATTLAADGALVGVHYGKNAAAADAVVAEIKQAGGDAFAFGADLAAKDAAATFYAGLDAQLVRRNGKPNFDILINNAGVAPFVGFAETTEEAMDQIYAVNVRAVFFITQAAVSRLNDGGRIVSTSSIVARLPYSAVPAYSALKAPINNLTKSLAIELGPRNITVNAVAPGVIDTDLADFVRSEDGAKMALSMQALKRIGKPEDVADVVAFLAGPRARWVTGQTIEAGGGSGLTVG